MKIFEKPFNKFLNWKYFIFSMLIFSIISIFFTNQVTLRDFPNSADEYSYSISAELFSEGKLSVPSPNHKEFFDFYHVINDGKFYGKYSPGWPFFLMFGKIIGFPMIINLTFGILTLIVVYLIGKELFSEKIARLSLLLMAISPFFMFTSASYFSHSSQLFFLSLFVYIYFKNLKSDKNLNWFLMGIIIGISFSIRQLESFVLGACFLIHYISVAIKNKEPIKKSTKKALLFLAGFLILFSIFLLYNYLQTGNPFLMPFTKYNPRDKFLAFNNKYLYSFSWSLKNNLLRRSLNLNIWVPFCFVFMIMGLFSKKKYKYLIFSIFFFLLIAYIFYARSGVNRYGPRYLYSSSFAIFLLMAVGLEKLNKKIFNFAMLITILLNLGFLVYASSLFHAQVMERMEVYDKVKTQNISNAIVFLNCSRRSMCSGTMPALDLTRNGIYFNNPVLYVHDLGKKNTLLMEDFPDRDYYLWNCEKINFNYIRFINFREAENINCKITKIGKK